MVKSCSAYGCNNERTPGVSRSFHRFPLKNPELLKLWVNAMRRENFSPRIHSVLCSDHFTQNSYLESSKNGNLLKKDAVPTIFNITKAQNSKHRIAISSYVNRVMPQEDVNNDTNNLFSENINSASIKEEFEDDYLDDNKVTVCETTININGNEFNADNVKTEVSSGVYKNIVGKNEVKDDLKMEFNNEQSQLEMAGILVDDNNKLISEDIVIIKEEFQDNNSIDNKISIYETNIKINSTDFNLDNIKTELSSSEERNNVKLEDDFSSVGDIKMEVNSEELLLTKCSFCETYLEKEYLEYHIKNCSKKNYISRSESHDCPSASNKRKRQGRGGIFKCTQCKYQTTYRAELRIHINDHYNVKHSRGGKCFSESFKRKLHSNYKYYFETYPKTKHPENVVYKCTRCDFRTNHEHTLKAHVVGVHHKGTNYNNSDIKQHLDVIHTKE